MPEATFDGAGGPDDEVSAVADSGETVVTEGDGDVASTVPSNVTDDNVPDDADATVAVASAPAPVGLALDDPALAGSERAARAALAEIAPVELVGALVRVDDEGDGVYSLRFATSQPGYADWLWTVAMNRLVDESEPNVLETELLPGPDALLAPAWVPWADRLAEYEASHSEATDGDADADEDVETAALPVSTRRRRRTRVRVDASAVEAGDAVTDAESGAAGTDRVDDGTDPDVDGAGGTDDETPGRRAGVSRPARGTVLRTGSRRRRTVRGRAAADGARGTNTDEGSPEAE